MGWVTLTLRKKELKRSHADYQMRELQISREERQMARDYHYQQTVLTNDKNQQLNDIKEQYNDQKSDIREKMDAIREAVAEANNNQAATSSNSSTSSGSSSSSSSSSTSSSSAWLAEMPARLKAIFFARSAPI